MPDRPGALLAFRALMLVVVVLLSMLVFTHLPIFSSGREQWWQLSVSSGLTLWPGPTILVLALALIVVAWQNEWRQITPAQARLMLRSTFLSLHYRDLKMVVMRRLRLSKSGAAQQSLGRPAVTLPSVIEVTPKH